MHYLIVTEKNSAKKNFSKALGGNTGKLNSNDTYTLVSGEGAMTTLVEPGEYNENWKSWSLEEMPWDFKKIRWRTKVINSRKRKLLNYIKKESLHADIWVLAGDTDPSAQGSWIGAEILLYCKFKGQIKRMYFADESTKEIRKGIEDLVELPNDIKEWPEYQKGQARNYFDWYTGLQYTRAATLLSKNSGFDFKIINEGRLKSFIFDIVRSQQEKINNFIPKSKYAVAFKDENDNIYRNSTKKIKIYDKKEDVPLSFAEPSNVIKKSEEICYKRPPKLIDMAGLVSALSPQGFTSKEISQTYQQMYEDSIVSYPRTEDKTLTTEQYKELIENSTKIAKIVGIDTSLLTHHQLRKEYIGNGAHGANRPGKNIPESLASLQDNYGKLGKEIYMLLSKSALSLVCEDLKYKKITGSLVKYPQYITTFTNVIDLNWKSLWNTQKEDKKLGNNAVPIIDTLKNKKPEKPTLKWLTRTLRKNNVGTGASVISVFAEIIDGKTPSLFNKRGVLSLTDRGQVAAQLICNTNIASADTTKEINQLINNVNNGKATIAEVLTFGKRIIIEDYKKMQSSSKELVNLPIKKPKTSKQKIRKEYSIGSFTIFENEKAFYDDEFIKSAKNKDNSQWKGLYLPKHGNKLWKPSKPLGLKDLELLLKGQNLLVNSGNLVFNSENKRIELQSVYVIDCPFDQSKVYLENGMFKCQSTDCKFELYFKPKMLGKDVISISDIKQLVSDGKTRTYSMVSKKNKKFKANFYLNYSSKKIELNFQ